MNRAELKMEAKDKLKNVWAETIKISIILFVISFGAGLTFGIGSSVLGFSIGLSDDEAKLLTDIVSNIVSIVISGLLSFGMMSYFLKISRGEQATCNELFSKVNMFWKFIVLSICMSIAVVLGFICFIIPGIILALGFSQAILVVLDNPEISAIDALKVSYDMMKGHKMDYFILQLSFLGWAFLMIFTLGIGYLWLIPYMTVTECIFYNKIREEYQSKNLS